MEKLSSEQVTALLEDAAHNLRKVAAERDTLLQEVASLRRHQDAEKLASVMQEKGLHQDWSREDLVQHLEKAAQQDPGRYNTIREAVDLIGPDMGAKIASLGGGAQPAGGLHPFEQYILGQIG